MLFVFHDNSNIPFFKVYNYQSWQIGYKKIIQPPEYKTLMGYNYRRFFL